MDSTTPTPTPLFDSLPNGDEIRRDIEDRKKTIEIAKKYGKPMLYEDVAKKLHEHRLMKLTQSNFSLEQFYGNVSLADLTITKTRFSTSTDGTDEYKTIFEVMRDELAKKKIFVELHHRYMVKFVFGTDEKN